MSGFKLNKDKKEKIAKEAAKELKEYADVKDLDIGARFVIIDGKEEKQYDGIVKGTLIFSPDSKHVAYRARAGNKQFVVVDGKEEKQYDALYRCRLGGSRIDGCRHLWPHSS